MAENSIKKDIKYLINKKNNDKNGYVIVWNKIDKDNIWKDKEYFLANNFTEDDLITLSTNNYHITSIDSNIPEIKIANDKQGSFTNKDIPRKIKGIRKTDYGIEFIIEWEYRNDLNYKPLDSITNNIELRKHSPLFLAKFYEDNIIFNK